MFLQARGKALDQFRADLSKADLQRRLETLPQTPGGRKVRGFVNEVDHFFDAWEKEKNKPIEVMQRSRRSKNLRSCWMRSANQRDRAGLSSAEKMAKIEEKVRETPRNEKILRAGDIGGRSSGGFVQKCG